MRATRHDARGQRSSACLSFQDARCSGASATSTASAYGSSVDARPASRSRIASAASRDETKHSYMPSPETGSISPAASPTSSARSPRSASPAAAAAAGGRAGPRARRVDRRAQRRRAQVLADPRPLVLPRADADVHVVALREHPAVAARDVRELDDRAPRVPLARDGRRRRSPRTRRRGGSRRRARARFAVVPFAPSAPTIDVGVDRLAVERASCRRCVDACALAHLHPAPACRVEEERVEPPPLRHPHHRPARAAHDRVAVAEAELDDVDLLLDDRRRVDRALRTARMVIPPPHGLSRGKRALSTSSTDAPASARRYAVVDPAGPPPTTSTSKRFTP